MTYRTYISAVLCSTTAIGLQLMLLPVAQAENLCQSRCALLIGVSKYVNLAEKHQLKGPANDVVLMRKLLVEKFGFADSNEEIRVLSEEAGRVDETLLPSRRNIESAFQKLIQQVDEGGEAVIFLAGHGSQQPALPDSLYPEPDDNLDEIFLPRDVDKWDGEGSRAVVPKAITDDEFAGWFAALRAKQIRLWVIFDCCHAGHMTRAFGERERSVSANELGITSTPGGKPGNSRYPPVDIAQDGMAIVYACDSREKAIERVLPKDGDQHYGLLTYCLNGVLAKASGSLSYRELVKRIHAQYISLGRHQGPTPSVEGGDADRDVLSVETIKRSAITVTQDEKSGKFHIDAGRLLGLTKDTILSLHPPPGEPDRIIGYVKIVEVGLNSAIVKRIAHQRAKKARIRETRGSRCKVAEIDYGDLRLGFAVDPNDGTETAIAEAVRRDLEGQLVVLESEPSSLVRHANVAAQADWLLRWNDGDVYLVPGSNSLLPEVGASPSELGPFRTDDTLLDKLRTSVFRIARAQNLLRLAAEWKSLSTDDPADAPVQLQIEILRFDNRDDPTGDLMEPPFTVRPGNRMQYVVTNTGEERFDLTVLEINSKLGIAAHYPTAGRRNRLEPGDGPRALPWIKISNRTFGREHIVFLAVKSRGVRRNFTRLTQPSITGYRQAGTRSSGFDRLMEQALYGEGTSRALSADLNDHQFKVVPFNVVRHPE